MATPEELEQEAMKRSQQRKADPFEQDARAELRRYQKETDQEREERQKKNRETSPDIQRKEEHGTLRNRFLAQNIGKHIRIDLIRGPAINGKLLGADFTLGQLQVAIPRQSPPSIVFIQLKHVVRLEIFPD